MAVENNLSEYSTSYRELAHVYEEFSIAEDYPQFILNYLIPCVTGKDVADIGCGNGKYLNLLSGYSASIIGMDKSFEQVKLARSLCSNHANVAVCLTDATHIPLNTSSVDVVMACWMLGTILEKHRQEEVISEMKRICKPGGKIILVENMPGSEFEKLRGRFPDPLDRTEKYNNFLLDNGFQLSHTVDTYFQFPTVDNARDVFHTIWKDRLVGEIKNEIIEHKVGLFSYEKSN